MVLFVALPWKVSVLPSLPVDEKSTQFKKVPGFPQSFPFELVKPFISSTDTAGLNIFTPVKLPVMDLPRVRVKFPFFKILVEDKLYVSTTSPFNARVMFLSLKEMQACIHVRRENEENSNSKLSRPPYELGCVLPPSLP